MKQILNRSQWASPPIGSVLTYLASVVLSALVLAVTFLVHSWVEIAVYPAFLVAVVTSAWLGGWGPGALSTVLSSLACNFFFLSPIGSFVFSAQVGHMAEFLLCGIALTALAVRLRKSVDDTAAALTHTRLLTEASAHLETTLEPSIAFERISRHLVASGIVRGAAVWVRTRCGVTASASEGLANRFDSSRGPIADREPDLATPGGAGPLLSFPLRGPSIEEGCLVLASGRKERRVHPGFRSMGEVLADRLSAAVELRVIHSAALREIDRRRAVEEDIRRLNTDLEDRVRSRTAELEAALAELSAFCYTVAHDLRSPLRAMSGLVDILLEDQVGRLDDQGRANAERIGGAARRMDDLIQGLLGYSRLARGELTLEDVDLDNLCGSILSDMRPALEDCRARLQVDRPLGCVRANSIVLRQAISNLIENAAKFVSPGSPPQIRLRSEGRDSVIRLWVDDGGIGIAPEYHQKIFGVFERLHRSEDYPGTGIGLAIVKRAVERMGGRTGVESEPGRGSSFWIELAKCRQGTNDAERGNDGASQALPELPRSVA